MFGPVAVGLTTDAARVEPFRMSLEVFVVFVNVIDNEIHHHAHSGIVCSIHHGVQFVGRTQAWFNTSCFGWPVPVEGCNVVHAIRSLARAVGCGVEGRQPKCIDAQVSEVARFNLLGHASKITALPVSTLRCSCRNAVVAQVCVHKTVGHDHVNQRVFPNKGGMRPSPKRHQ